MTNEGGDVTWTGAYKPFGEMQAGAGNVHGFTGKELDSESGLNYFCQRYYDAQIGRFMSLDPVDQKGVSRDSTPLIKGLFLWAMDYINVRIKSIKNTSH
ncbi:MAG: RHS repeat-associated core domain-containing protein [candidate division WOR-3 bacterium]|nr:RHS repeat-associated core domain-containing protein [candidate division WOR-3 bacterium]